MATQHPPGDPESPGWRCGAESGAGTAQTGTFCLEFRLKPLILIGAESGVGTGVVQKLNPSIWSRSQRSWAIFSRNRSWSRTRRDIELEVGAGARTITLLWILSCSRSKLSRLRIPVFCHAVPSLWLRVLLATRRPPGCPTTSWPIGALGALLAACPVSQAWGTHREDQGIAQWMLSSGVRIRAFRACLVLGNCNAHAIT